MERKFIMSGKIKYYYDEVEEDYTYECPFKGMVTQKVLVKKFDPIDVEIDKSIPDKYSHNLTQIFCKRDGSAWED